MDSPKKYTGAMAALAATLVLTGCDNSASGNSQTVDLTLLQGRVSTLESQVTTLSVESSKSIWLQLSNTGYTPLLTDLGTITVQMTKIEPLGSGSRVFLKFGNPLSVTPVQLDLTGRWGPVDKDGTPDLSKAHDFSTSIEEKISAGAWTYVSFQIDGGKPDEIGFLQINTASVQRVNMFGS